MVRLNFEDSTGIIRTVEASPGQSIMRAARDAGVDGIVAVCGGNMLCGTCRVAVAADWAERIGSPGEDEAAVLEILDGRAPFGPNARLACQIEMAPELDGVTIRLPRYQLGI